MHDFIPVNEPLLIGNEKKYLEECIDTGWISSEGPFVKKFENEFAKKVNRNYGISVCNGSVALDVAVAALGIGSGDEVQGAGMYPQLHRELGFPYKQCGIVVVAFTPEDLVAVGELTPQGQVGYLEQVGDPQIGSHVVSEAEVVQESFLGDVVQKGLEGQRSGRVPDHAAIPVLEDFHQPVQIGIVAEVSQVGVAGNLFISVEQQGQQVVGVLAVRVLAAPMTLWRDFART